MPLSPNERATILTALRAWQRRARARRPSFAKLARSLHVCRTTLRRIYANGLQRQNTRISERLRIISVSPLDGPASNIESSVFSPRTVRRIRQQHHRPIRKRVRTLIKRYGLDLPSKK